MSYNIEVIYSMMSPGSSQVALNWATICR